jgi:hypothetical protein
VYPYTKIVTSPAMARFVDDGYGDAAYDEDGSSPCDVLLTIDTAGKALDPVVSNCSKPKLEKPAMDSLLNSLYKPGKLNGRPVPIRLQVHLEFDGFGY